MKFMLGIFLVLVVLGGIFSFADIGGNMILELAKNYLNNELGLTLKAESITGNPVKGYRLNNFELADDKGNEILAAGFLSGRVNFAALLKGKIKLAEISLGGLNMDVDTLLATIENLKLPEDKAASSSSPDEEEPSGLSDIPVDRVSLRDSRLTSQFGTLDIREIGADLDNLNIDIDAAVNGLALKGTADLSRSAGLTAINRSDIAFGSGKIIATGGLVNDMLDIHATVQDMNISELTALYPMLKAEDFSGTINLNADLTGQTDNPRFFGAIDYKGSKVYGFPVERLSANISCFENRLSVGNLQASIFNVPVQGEAAVANRPGEAVSVMVKLDGSEANLDGLDKVLGLPELKTLSGKVSVFNANISGPVNALSGLVNFTAPRIAYSGRALTNIRAQMKLAKSDTAHVDGKFMFEGAQGYLNGNIASVMTKPDINLTAKIVDLDIKRIENMIPDASDYKLSGKITASVNVKGNVNNPSVSGSVNSPEFSGFDQKITKPVINFAFANKTLTLSKTEGTLNGMPINVSGTVGPLPSDNPSLNINATITMSPASLKAYVPDINQYALKGTVNAGLKIQGPVNNPSVNLLASSSNLQAMNMITAKDIELTTALNGDLSKLDKLSINAAAKSITASGVTFSGVNAKLDKNGDKIILGGLNAKSGSGTITGSGTASASGKSPLDFHFRFTNLALAPLAASSGIDLKGNLSGTLKVAGSNENPSVSLNANVPSLNAQGFAFTNMLADISGTMKNITLNKFRAEVEGVEVSASGTVQVTPSLKANIAINGANIKLERLLDEYPGLKGNLAGIASLNFNLTGSGNNFSGKGALTSQAVKAFGMNLTNINLPLSYSGTTFASNGGTAKLYGGTLKNTLTFDLNTMKFTDNIDASGVDVNGLIQDISGGLGGKITGTGKLTMKITGNAKENVTYSGNGQFSMGAGAITGFKWLDIITKLHKSDGIRYANVTAPLTLQTGKLILKAGSIANANKNDALYRYAKLSQNGTIDFGGSDVTMNILTESVINYQLINAIQGGGKGGLEALFKGGVSSFQDGLKAFLSGGLKGVDKTASTGDFRTVTLKISGKAASPSFSNLKIGPSTLKAQTQSTDKKQAQQTPAKLTDRIINRAVDAIVPSKNKTTPSAPKVTAPATITQPKTTQPASPKKDTKQEIKDKVKEELTKGIKKGLGGLFKK